MNINNNNNQCNLNSTKETEYNNTHVQILYSVSCKTTISCPTKQLSY